MLLISTVILVMMLPKLKIRIEKIQYGSFR